MNNGLLSFPRAAWERSQGALRRELRPTYYVYGTQRVQHCIPTQRVGTSKEATMIVSVQTVRYLDGYRLWLKFNTDESGEVDLQDMIFKYKVAEPLRDIEYFKAFKLDDWPTLAWDCGFDISPETLYERATGKVVEWLQPNRDDGIVTAT